MDTTQSPPIPSPSPLTRSSRLTRTQVEELLIHWQSSQLSLAAFARERGLDVNRLYSWRQRLQRCLPRDREGSSAAAGLAQVRMVDQHAAGVVVAMPNGLRIELGADWSLSAIAALCGALSC